MADIPKFEIERHFRVCDNESGSHITVKPDCDGLDLIEINDSMQPGFRLIMQKKQALLLIDAIQELVDNMP